MAVSRAKVFQLSRVYRMKIATIILLVLVVSLEKKKNSDFSSVYKMKIDDNIFDIFRRVHLALSGRSG